MSNITAINRSIQVVPASLASRAEGLVLKYNEHPCDCFSLADMPPKLNDYCSAICSTTSAHPIIVMSSILTASSAFIGNRIFIAEGDNNKCYFQKLRPNIWIISVADSGQYKSTALTKGCKIAEDNRRDVLTEMALLKEEINRTTDPKKKKQLQADFENSKLEISTKDVMLPNRMTPEALLDHMGKGHRGAIFHNEIGGFIQSLTKNNNSELMRIYTDLYDCPSTYRNTTKTQGDDIIIDPYVSICGVSTIAWLNDSLKKRDVYGGFYTRFLFFAIPPADERPPALPEKKYATKGDTEAPIKHILHNLPNSRVCQLSDAAVARYNTVYNEIYDIKDAYPDTDSEILVPYIRRWCPSVLKVAMIMQLYLDPTTNEISTEAIDCSFAFIKPAIRSTIHLYNKNLGETEFDKKVNEIHKAICTKYGKTKKPVTNRELSQTGKLKGLDSKKIFDELEIRGLAQRIPGKSKCYEAWVPIE